SSANPRKTRGYGDGIALPGLAGPGAAACAVWHRGQSSSPSRPRWSGREVAARNISSASGRGLPLTGRRDSVQKGLTRCAGAKDAKLAHKIKDNVTRAWRARASD